jgi:hypothetical protein
MTSQFAYCRGCIGFLHIYMYTLSMEGVLNVPESEDAMTSNTPEWQEICAGPIC